MRVLLVATNREQAPYPVAPLGVLCVAAAARAAGHDVDFLDLNMVRSPQRALEKRLRTGQYQAVGFGSRNLDNCLEFTPRFYFHAVRELAETVRSCFKGPFILGGSGFSVEPRGWLRRVNADCGVLGEGERTFPEVLNRLEAGRSLEGLAGVLTASANGNVNGPILVESLGELLTPAHELCNYAAYVRRGGFIGVQTKRGCPFKCSYCNYTQLEGRRYRLRPPDAIAQEIETVVRRTRQEHVFFVDSVFNDPREHALAVCAAVSRRRLRIKWNAFCNPVGFDAELAQAMAQAGCVGVEFGLDAVTPKMLKALGKPFGQAQIQTALQAAHDAGIPMLLGMLFGGPGETWTDIEEAQAFLDQCAPANCVFASIGIRVYGGTPLAEVAVREGQVKPDQDLFEPTYYLSPALAEQTVENLDRIARRRYVWSSPADWRRPMMSWAQKVIVLLNERPQWRNIWGYGKFMRRGGQ